MVATRIIYCTVHGVSQSATQRSQHANVGLLINVHDSCLAGQNGRQGNRALSLR